MLDGSSYSLLDRLMHRVAFAHPSVQKVLADIEASRYQQEWLDQPVTKPIFVTSLPRAGTTLVLQLLARLPAVATHTYRDMPFVRAPVLWNRLSQSFHANDEEVERAHGDGMLVNTDSPEAFEEVLWLSHFPEHYGKDGIRPWSALAQDFVGELCDHMRRIILLRAGSRSQESRYLSKNNANIARIDALRAAFPDCMIVVPLRHPLAQARSMLRQHVRFANLQAGDRFALRYMADIGHFEFGLAHRPILFPGVAQLADRYRPDRIEYWTGYWAAAFSHLAQRSNVLFIDYQGFCSDGGNFRALCEMLDLQAGQDQLERAGRQIRPQAEIGEEGDRPENLSEAVEIFEQLRKKSAFGRSASKAHPVRK